MYTPDSPNLPFKIMYMYMYITRIILNLYTFPHYSDCQRRDWSYHRSKCRGGRPTPVGLPFVVSLPISQLTYSRLASVAEKFARSALFNVHVQCTCTCTCISQYSVLSIWCKTHKTSNMPSSTCTCMSMT